MHDENFKDVQQLIALKRHEQPDDAYFEEFMDEFHRRQRQELLQRSSFSLFRERVGTWFSGTNKWNIVWGGGLAYAAVMVGFFFWPKSEITTQPEIDTTPIKHVPKEQVVPAEKEDMLKPDKDKEPIHEVY
ncbi:MAG: hypothetical protein KJO79_06880 [Verrucomicrobiae bacterium]|nr:hypothetical protein [Verrucomicrobiae bacterium]NNJ86885.1 hypothetical protein [Akkermansiaceae bacterium]